MDELMQKITEKLNLTIDKAPEVYQTLKWQYSVYDTCNFLIWIMVMFGVIAFVYGLSRTISLFANHYVNEFSFSRKLKEVFWIISPFIVVIVILIYIYMYRNLHTPDVLFLKEVLRK